MIDDANLDSALGRILRRKMIEATQRVANHVGENTPQESGHAHQIWEGAFNKVNSVRVKYSQSSGDRLAANVGTATANLQGLTQNVKVNSNAAFIRTIEYGGILKPIRPGGHKRASVTYPGPYLGARFMYSTGWLCWRDSAGELKFATEVNYKAKSPVRRAIEQTAQEMRRA